MIVQQVKAWEGKSKAQGVRSISVIMLYGVCSRFGNKGFRICFVLYDGWWGVSVKIRKYIRRVAPPLSDLCGKGGGCSKRFFVFIEGHFFTLLWGRDKVCG